MSIALPDYAVGQKPRLTVTFTSNGVATDPTTVTFNIQAPSKAITTYVYGTDIEVNKDSTGVYYVDWEFTEGGYWIYRWKSDGIVEAATLDQKRYVGATVFS